MEPQDVAQFAAMNDMSFAFGIFFGSVITGFFTKLLNIFANRFERPRRVRVHLPDHEVGQFEYFYMFKGRYYTLGEYQDLQKTSRKYIVVNPDYQKK